MSTVEIAAANGKSAPVLWGLLAEFPAPEALLHGAEAVRDAGLKRWDTHTPYPIHGMDRAMGIKSTPLPWLVFLCGLGGAAGGLGLQWFTNAYDYPYLISGKPVFSLPANIPVMFETTILCAAIGAVLGMLALNGLPQLYHAVFAKPVFRRATSDGYFLSIEAADAKFDRKKLEALLRERGALSVEAVEEQG